MTDFPFGDKPVYSFGWTEGKISIKWCTYEHPSGHMNGYAYIPPACPVDLDKISVHGGFTYGYSDDFWEDGPSFTTGWVGFDTAHAGDEWESAPHTLGDWGIITAIRWTPEMVEDEAQKLAAQIAILIGMNGGLADDLESVEIIDEQLR